MVLLRRYRRLTVFALTLLGVIPWLAYVSFYPDALDGHAYFVAQSGSLYVGAWGTADSYVYSPAFSQLVEPLRWLGWDGFRTTLRLLDVAAIALLTGPLTGLLIFAHPVSLEFNIGNIHLLLACCIVAGFRWPWTWSFVLLTKLTPGVGLVWFGVRREWRKLGVALGVTAAIVVVSFGLAPGDWFDYVNLLAHPQTPPPGTFILIDAPLPLRVAAAAVLITWGARRDRRWTVLVGAFLALPSVWETSTAMLLGLVAIRYGWSALGARPTAPAPPVGIVDPAPAAVG